MSAFDEYRLREIESQREIFARAAADREPSRARHSYYYENLRERLRAIVEKDKRVLCLRSDTGQYLEWVEALRAGAEGRWDDCKFHVGKYEQLNMPSSYAARLRLRCNEAGRMATPNYDDAVLLHEWGRRSIEEARLDRDRGGSKARRHGTDD